MQEVYKQLGRLASTPVTVLIRGETGTGKELVARAIYQHGHRAHLPFIAVSCAAIPEPLLESELFGHERGAFTGADARRIGRFEQAHNGTIFLDEVGELGAGTQAKLLRVLQDGVVERVGSSQSRQVDVRVLAATNRDLKSVVADGQFREDLYFRLEVLPIRIPPLRERIEDLTLLIDHFRQKLAKRLGRPAPTVSAAALDAMKRYRWPGNVRELENTLEQVFILCDRDSIGVDDLPEKFKTREPQTGEVQLPSGGLILEEVEQDLIRQALARSGGRIKEAAELLGLSYKTLQYRLKKHDIDKHEAGSG